ncbi:MAG: hypothetical protein AAFV71_28510 [Cyanobacteria bacterium J06633_8]
MIHLHKEHLHGEVQGVGVVVDKLRKIKTELKKHDYILAIKAYKRRKELGPKLEEGNIFLKTLVMSLKRYY